MQLILLLMLALAGGGEQTLKEVKPILENLGGSEALGVIEKAEELSAMLTAVQSLTGGNGGIGGTGGMGGKRGNGAPHYNRESETGGEFAQHGFPLAPIAAIADENITYCLSRYITLGE